MNNLVVFYTAFFLCLQWLFVSSVYAGSVKIETHQIYMPVPGNEKYKISDKEAAPVSEVDNKKKEETISLVERTLPEMSIEHIEMKRKVNALFQKGVHIQDIDYFKSKQDIYTDYLEQSFYRKNDPQLHIQLIMLTSYLLGNDAEPVLLKWGELFRNHPEQLRAIVRSLSIWPSTERSEKFVISLLKDEVPDKEVLKSALLYLAWNKVKSAKPYLSVYTVPVAGTDYQYLSLYLAGVLGEKEYLPVILEALNDTTPVYKQYYLLLGLSQLLAKDDFVRVINSSYIDSDVREKVLRVINLKDMIKPTNISQYQSLLISSLDEERSSLLDFLIKTMDRNDLLDLAEETGPVGVILYHRADIAERNNGTEELKRENMNNSEFIFILVVACMLLIWLSILFARKNNKQYLH